jgi:hypothetical protein
MSQLTKEALIGDISEVIDINIYYSILREKKANMKLFTRSKLTTKLQIEEYGFLKN